MKKKFTAPEMEFVSINEMYIIYTSPGAEGEVGPWRCDEFCGNEVDFDDEE